MLLHDSLVTLAAFPVPTPSSASSAYVELNQPEATLLAGIIVGIGAVLGFVASLLNRRSLDKATRTTDQREREKSMRDHKREIMAARQDRYTKIADQLASQHAPIRLAGIYALVALVDEWQEAEQYGQRNACLDLLCAYLRAEPRAEGDSECRTAILLAIMDHTERDAEVRWPEHAINLHGADLSNADLEGIHLPGANLSNTCLRGASLDGSILRGTMLWNADLTGASLMEADLSGAKLMRCNFTAANLTEASLAKAQLRQAIFPGASLGFADLGNANLVETNFSGVDLRDTCLVGANLTKATLIGADLRGTFLKDANLSGAFLSRAQLDTPTRSPNPELEDNLDEHGTNYLVLARWDAQTEWPEGFDIQKVEAFGSK